MKIKKGIYSIVAWAGITLMVSQAVFADVTVVYKITSPNGNGTQTIRYIDKQHVRIDMTDAINKKTTILKLGDKVYAITGKVVQDMSQLADLMTAMRQGNKGPHKTQAPIKYKKTGRTETIAGIKGKVYRFVERGKQHEIVLAQNQDLQNAVLGVIEISKAASAMMPDDAMKRMQEDTSVKNLAMLRLDKIIRLQSMNTSAIPASSFKLPAKPQQMGGIGNVIKGIFGR